VARGYSPAIFFALAAWFLMEARGVGPTGRVAPGAGIAFWICCLLGMLSHLTFVQVYFGLLSWSLVAALRAGELRGRALGRAAFWHAVPLLFLLWLYRTFVAHILVGGAPEDPHLVVLLRFLSWAFGAPDLRWVGLLLAAGAATALLADARGSARRGSSEWVGTLAAVVAAPILTLVVTTPAFLLPRYFLLAGSILLLVVARVLARLLEGGGARRALGVLLCLLFALGNASRLVPMLRWGRGEYAAAVETMARETVGTEILVGSDHDFRNGEMLEYQGRRLKTKTLRYVPQAEFPRIRPEWFVMHAKTLEREGPESLPLFGLEYRRVAHFPYAAPDGFHWWLYRRAAD
jgi:hypothetical protein